MVAGQSSRSSCKRKSKDSFMDMDQSSSSLMRVIIIIIIIIIIMIDVYTGERLQCNEHWYQRGSCY